MSIIRLGKLLKSDAKSGLSDLVRAAQEMQDLTTSLRACLDDEAAAQLLSANLRDNGDLVLVCGSSAWASRLRFESAALLEAARAMGANAVQCKVRVASQMPG